MRAKTWFACGGRAGRASALWRLCSALAASATAASNSSETITFPWINHRVNRLHNCLVQICGNRGVASASEQITGTLVCPLLSRH